MMLSVLIQYGDECWDDWQIGKGLEGSGCDLIEVLSQHFLEGLSRTMKKLSLASVIAEI
jgi:hypothetical protein